MSYGTLNGKKRAGQDAFEAADETEDVERICHMIYKAKTIVADGQESQRQRSTRK